MQKKKKKKKVVFSAAEHMKPCSVSSVFKGDRLQIIVASEHILNS